MTSCCRYALRARPQGRYHPVQADGATSARPHHPHQHDWRRLQDDGQHQPVSKLSLSLSIPTHPTDYLPTLTLITVTPIFLLCYCKAVRDPAFCIINRVSRIFTAIITELKKNLGVHNIFYFVKITAVLHHLLFNVTFISKAF